MFLLETFNLGSSIIVAFEMGAFARRTRRCYQQITIVLVFAMFGKTFQLAGSQIKRRGLWMGSIKWVGLEAQEANLDLLEKCPEELDSVGTQAITVNFTLACLSSSDETGFHRLGHSQRGHSPRYQLSSTC
jgi:hypothetical protein